MPTEGTRVGTTSRAIMRSNVVVASNYTNATVTASSVLSLFTPAASGVYVIQASLWVTSAAATTGVQLGVSGPSSGVANSAIKVTTASAAGTDLVSHQALNAYQAAAAGLTTPTLAEIEAWVQWGGTAATATVDISARSEVAGSTITVLAGSVVEWRRVL